MESDVLPLPNHTNTTTTQTTIKTLLTQYQTLQSSFKAFQSQALKQHTPIDAGSYLKQLVAEGRHLERLSSISACSTTAATAKETGPQHANIQHALDSSNLGFLQRVWDVACRCRRVVALKHRVLVPNVVGREGEGRNGGGKGVAVVDVVAEDGLLWVRIVTVGERKLLFELAREGGDVWEDDGREGDGEDEDVDVGGGEDEIPLVKMVRDLVIAADGEKVNWRHPEVLVYFPRLEESKIMTPVVRKILADLRMTGATIHCGPGPIRLRDHALIGVESTRKDMLPVAVPAITSTVNLDCTILLAMISDLSHLRLDENDAYNASLKKQLVAERGRPLLTDILYPALHGKKLITSSRAAQRMREIVGVLATPTERRRAAIMFQEGDFASINVTRTDLISSLRKETVYDIPKDLQLPIEIIDTDFELNKDNLPTGANLLEPILSDINRSVFWLGWTRGITTATSNRTTAKQIERILNEAPGDIQGPDMWVIEVARSLVGKERRKRRRKRG